MSLEDWKSEKFLDTKQAAELLQLSPDTLMGWRKPGVMFGPRWFRLGHNIVRYRESDVLNWLQAQYDAGPAEPAPFEHDTER